MKIALIYDEATPGGEGLWVEAEYESPDTIEALLEAIGRHCERAVPVRLGPDTVEVLERERPDLAFNIAEGSEGPSRETLAPAMLDYLGIPYTASDGVTLGVSLNKAMTKRLARDLDIPTPEFRLFHSAQEAEAVAEELDYPLLVKPNYGGSSVGVGPASIVREPGELPGHVGCCICRYQQPCLAEGYVDGFDVTVGLLGNDEPEVLPIGRVVAPGGMYSEMTKKLHEREIVCPYSLSEPLERRLKDWTLALYRAIGARDLARVDYMMDTDGNAWMLEINPLPGLSPFYGVYPVLAEAAGYDYVGLIGRIIDLALERSAAEERTTDERLATGTARRYQHR